MTTTHCLLHKIPEVILSLLLIGCQPLNTLLYLVTTSIDDWKKLQHFSFTARGFPENETKVTTCTAENTFLLTSRARHIKPVAIARSLDMLDTTIFQNISRI